MAASKKDKALCRIITPEFRVSYPHVFKAQAPRPQDKPKFSITMLFPKDSDFMGQSPEAEPRSLKQVIVSAKNVAFGSKENWPSDLESPWVDGDKPKYADKEGYKGHWVLKASTGEDKRPGVVDANMVPITDPALLYPGCYARAYVYAYVWTYMNKQGVGFILDHVQKLRDGASFGGKRPVEQVFSAVAYQSSPEEDEGAEEEPNFLG